MLITLVVILLFDWYYSNMEELIEEKDHDHAQYAGETVFAEFLLAFNKTYNNSVDYEMRKETFMKNYNITRFQAGSALMKVN